MKTDRTLEFLVYGDFILTIATVACDFALEPTLPAPLRTYLAANSADAWSPGDVFRLALWVTVTGATFVGWIGLVHLWRPARAVYLASWIGMLLLYLTSGPSVSSPVVQALGTMAALTGGMTLGLTYFSDPRLEIGFRSSPIDV